VAPAVSVAAAPRTAAALVLAIAGEVFLGLALGFVASLVVVAARSAGELIGFAGGLSLAGAYDPAQGQQSTALGQFMDVTVTLLFMAVNGHHVVLRAIAASFAWVAPGQALAAPVVAGGLAALGGKLLRSGLELAAPVLAILFAVNVLLALLARVAPQMNVFSVGAPLMVAAALLGVAEGLPWMVTTASRLIGEIPGDIRSVLTGAGRGF
jgi:flagellar biosynthetic protein FliR